MATTEQLIKIKAELDAGHPVTGAYNIDDALARLEMVAFNVPRAASQEDLLKYFLLERYATNTGTDTTQQTLYGRLVEGSKTAIGGDVVGSVGKPMTGQGLTSCHALLRLLDSETMFNLVLSDTRIDTILRDARDVGVIGAGDKIAIQALTDNASSRAHEIGIPYVKDADITAARLV